MKIQKQPTLADSICDVRARKVKTTFFSQMNTLIDWDKISKIIDSDYLKVIFTSDGLSISKMVAAGNVVIRQKKRTTYSNSAIYVLQSEVLRLIGNPKILEEGNMYTADEITVLIKQNKVLFEPSAKIMINDKAKE